MESKPLVSGGPERQLVHIAGLPFDALDFQGAIERVATAIHDNRRLFLSTPNLNFVMAAQSDAGFRESIVQSDLSVADGMPLVWMARLMGLPLRERVAGASLFEALRQGAASSIVRRPIKVYFFGGPPGVAEKAAQAINTQDQHMRCVGFCCPGFGSVEEMSAADTLAHINASGADFLVVALGAQKGQAWIMHNLSQLSAPVVSHLGAVVNFVAGTVQRAPPRWQHWGMEWLWRIKEEPALFKRYWHDGWGFLHLLRTEVFPKLLIRMTKRP